MARFNPNELTEIADVAAVFGITRRRADQILTNAGIERVDRGRVPLKAALQACLRNVKEGLNRRRARSADSERLLLARAKEIEDRNVRAEEGLIEVAEHREMHRLILAEMRKGFDGAPARITTDLALQARLQAAFDEIFERAEKQIDDLTDEAVDPKARRH